MMEPEFDTPAGLNWFELLEVWEKLADESAYTLNIAGLAPIYVLSIYDKEEHEDRGTV